MGCCGPIHDNYDEGMSAAAYEYEAEQQQLFERARQREKEEATIIQHDAGFECCHHCKTKVFLKRDASHRYCGEVCRYWAKKKRQGKYDALKNQ
jgi:hypothetical protein